MLKNGKYLYTTFLEKVTGLFMINWALLSLTFNYIFLSDSMKSMQRDYYVIKETENKIQRWIAPFSHQVAIEIINLSLCLMFGYAPGVFFVVIEHFLMRDVDKLKNKPSVVQSLPISSPVQE
ncbi:hypothetical protein PCE1_004814 [Barthelona sp. PCE]